jgi:hypothetical protein
MWRRLLLELDRADKVEHEAEDLRQAHGAKAEAWCDALAASLPAKDQRRGYVRDLRRALKWVGDHARG